MPDVYATIAEQPQELQERIAETLRLRAEEPEMAALTDSYLSKVPWPENACVLEIGCGAGHITQTIAGRGDVGHVTGLDPSSVLLERARLNCRGSSKITFVNGDARELDYGDEEFDVVISHTALCHIPEPRRALTEAHRVLRPNGQLVIFDGDYATVSVAIGDFDPLQMCVDAVLSNYLHDKWFMRRLPRLLNDTGFRASTVQGLGYVKISAPQYLLNLVERGAGAIAEAGTVGNEFANALISEANERIAENRFYGEIMFASMSARRD